METLPEFDSLDEPLLRELKEAMATVVEVPVEFARAARESFTWRTIDADLDAVSLAFDSALDGVAVVRGPEASASRSLSFENPDVMLEVDVCHHEVSGRIFPSQAAVVRLQSAAGGSWTTTTDATGWFTFARTPPGPHRFECETGTGTLKTEWTLM